MPFGLDLKSIILGVVLALFVWPLIAAQLGNVGSKG